MVDIFIAMAKEKSYGLESTASKRGRYKSIGGISKGVNIFLLDTVTGNVYSSPAGTRDGKWELDVSFDD